MEDLDIDVLEMDDTKIDDVDLSGFGEIDDSVDFPHIKVATKALKEFLKVAKLICATGGRDIISKAVCLKADPANGKVLCKATDFDVYVEQNLELINTDKILTESVQIPTDILIKLTKAVPVNTVIYKNGEDFYIRLYGGDMQLENYSFPEDKFTFSDAVDLVGTLSGDDLKVAIKDLSPVVTAAVNPAERRILCNTEGAVASYMWAIIDIVKQFQPFDLKVKDLGVIKSLLVDKKNEVLKVFKTKDSNTAARCLVEGSDFKYAFLLSESTTASTMKSNINTVVTNDGVYVDFIQLYKMVEVAADLPYSVGKIGFNYTAEGITVNIMTKKSSGNIFNISGSIEGTVVPLKEELVVQAKLLRIVMRSFASKSTVRITLTDKGLGIKADDYSAALYAEAK